MPTTCSRQPPEARHARRDRPRAGRRRAGRPARAIPGSADGGPRDVPPCPVRRRARMGALRARVRWTRRRGVVAAGGGGPHGTPRRTRARLRRLRRHAPGGGLDQRGRHARAEGALPAGDLHRCGALVPALQRAGCRFRPRRPLDDGGARRRRVGGARPEGVDERRPRRAGRSSWRAPIPTSPSTAASRSSCATCGSRGSRSGRCARPTAPRTSTRCSSTAYACPTTCAWATRVRGGQSPSWGCTPSARVSARSCGRRSTTC